MKNSKRKNEKGFTLIELLAVIVVLAIIMILAVPNIIDSMNKAKKKSFQMYGEKMLNSALNQYESRKLLSEGVSSNKVNGTGEFCYTFKDMGITSSGNYYGYVQVNHSSKAGETTYQVFLTDGNFYYDGAYTDDVQNHLESIHDVTDYDATMKKMDGVCKPSGSTPTSSATE